MDIRKHSALMIKPLLAGLLICLLLTISNTPSVHTAPPSVLQQVLTAGELRVASSNGSTTYYEGANGLTGFEYSLVKGFADSLGVKLVIDNKPHYDELLSSVATHQYHLAAAGLTQLESQNQPLVFTSSYMQITQQLVYNNKLPQPASIDDLKGKEVLIIADDSHRERVRYLQEKFPALEWRAVINAETIDLLEMVHKGEADYAVVDSNAYDLNRYSYPKAQLAFDVSDPQPLAWALPISPDDSLLKAAQNYLSSIKQDGTLAKVTEQFFNQHIEEVTTGEAMVFAYRLENRLPQWADAMKEAAREFNLDWQLLAAISYQESHWEADAKSPTGVRGLMMLTKATARAMGVTNREDPTQSIYGGAKYLSIVLERLPESIQGEDRIDMALAAYNQGLGHLEDARVLTQRMGGDPNKWSDVRQYMPLLSKAQYYNRAKHGYMRGWEPVHFVKNVRNYHKILAWHQEQQAMRLASTGGNAIPSDQEKEAQAATNNNKDTSVL